MSNRVFYFFTVLILVLGLFLRFYKLGEIPIGTYWDETAMLVDARSLAETGRDIHGNSWFQAIFPSYGDYKLPVYIWFASLATKFFGSTALAVRLPSALAGAVTIVLAGLIAKELIKEEKPAKKRQLQLATMLVVALSFWDIMFSRAGFEGHLGQLFLGFSFYLALKASQKFWFLPLSGLLAVLALFTYYSTRFVWPAVFICLLVFNLASFKKIRPNKRFFGRFIINSLLAAIIFLLGIGVMNVSPYYSASQQFRLSASSILDQTPVVLEANEYQQLAGNTFLDKLTFHRHWLSLKKLLVNYSQNLSFEFLFLNGDQNLRHGTGQHGLFALSFLPIFLLGLHAMAQKNRSALFVLVVWWLAALLPASVPLDVPHALRSLNALLPIAIIISFGLVFIWQTQFRFKKVIIFGWEAWTVLAVGNFYYHLMTIYPVESATSWQSGYQELADAVVSELDKNDRIWVNIDDGRFYLWLLNNPKFSPQEIQTWPKDNNFQLRKVGNITLENFVYTNFNQRSTKLILAGKREVILTEVEKNHIVYRQIQPIFDQRGVERFILIYLN